MELHVGEFHEKLTGSGALLGLDLGTKTIGLAVSDASQNLASPLLTIRRTKFTQDVVELKKIINQREIKGLVLGLPLNMDGTEGPRAQSTRSFARNLLKEMDLPLLFWDERLSTFAAEQAMIEAKISFKDREKKIDAHAAAVILQDALDHMHQFAHPRAGGGPFTSQ